MSGYALRLDKSPWETLRHFFLLLVLPDPSPSRRRRIRSLRYNPVPYSTSAPHASRSFFLGLQLQTPPRLPGFGLLVYLTRMDGQNCTLGPSPNLSLSLRQSSSTRNLNDGTTERSTCRNNSKDDFFFGSDYVKWPRTSAHSVDPRRVVPRDLRPLLHPPLLVGDGSRLSEIFPKTFKTLPLGVTNYLY